MKVKQLIFQIKFLYKTSLKGRENEINLPDGLKPIVDGGPSTDLNEPETLSRYGSISTIGGVAPVQDPEAHSVYKQQKWYIILLQTFLPFFVAGFGMVAAGVLLDILQVSYSYNFIQTDQICLLL